jgi:hypothetical protein
MASSKHAGSGPERASSDDDRDTPYARPGRYGYGPMLVIGILAACALLAYGVFHRGETPSGGRPEATVGSTR